jgi:peptidoglycan/xylan/chitin deacetylase (PgdA/CDA1 family)
MYHEVTTADRIPSLSRRTQRKFIVTVNDFKSQLKFLRDAGFRTRTLDDIVRAIKEGMPVADKSVVITFDDGFEGNYAHAFPTLTAYGMQATFFVIVEKVDSECRMSWDQLKEMHAAGMSIQSHTMSHPLLGQLSNDKIKSELELSKARIEQRVGGPVVYLSLPMGSYNSSFADIACQVGYKAACTSNFGFVSWHSPCLLLPRIVVKGQYTLSEFVQILDCGSSMNKSLAMQQKVKVIGRRLIGERVYNFVYNRIYSIDA